MVVPPFMEAEASSRQAGRPVDPGTTSPCREEKRNPHGCASRLLYRSQLHVEDEGGVGGNRAARGARGP